MPAAASRSGRCRPRSRRRSAGRRRPGPGPRSREASAGGCVRVAGRSWNGTSGMWAAAPAAAASSAASRAAQPGTRPRGPLRSTGSRTGGGRIRSDGAASNPVRRTIGHRPRPAPAGSGIDPGTAPERVGFRRCAFIRGPSCRSMAVVRMRSPDLPRPVRSDARPPRSQRERRTGAAATRERRGRGADSGPAGAAVPPRFVARSGQPRLAAASPASTQRPGRAPSSTSLRPLREVSQVTRSGCHRPSSKWLTLAEMR